MKKMIPLCVLLLTACQSTPKATQTPTAPTKAHHTFAITGKIGVSTQTPTGRVAGSAFYDWGQADDRFAIDLTGALGIGATHIRFDGKEAILLNEQTAPITADSPSQLLKAATGWQAPIEVLPFWIMGQTAPDDKNSMWQGDRLTHSQNGDWVSQFEYGSTLPNKLIITHKEGHRVVMTITHVGR